MRIADKTKEQLSGELEALRLHVAGLEKTEAERRGMEDVLGQSIERFQTLLEEAPIGICNTDLKGKITYVNKRFEEVSGYSRQEVVGKNGLKLSMFSAETLRLLVKRLNARLRGKPSRLLEIQFKCKDGHWIWVVLEGKLMRERGIPVGFQLISRDITERKQAGEELQAEKNKLQSVIDALEYGLTIQDRDYNILYQNGPLKTFFGDHLGEKCYRVYEGKDKVCNGCPVEKAFRDGKSHSIERRVINRSGEVEFREYMANPVRDARGKIVSCLEIVRNVTERKQAEEALRKAEEQFHVLVEESPLGVSVIRKDSHYQYVNPKFVEVFGYTLEDIPTGREWFTKAYPAPEYRSQVISAWNADVKSLKRGEVGARTYTVTCKDGTEKIIRFRPVALETGSYFVIYEDITERKQAEEALQQSEERFRSIVENSQAGIMILDDTYRFNYVNDELCKISGYSPKEVIGQDFRQFLDGESRQLVADRYIRRQRGEEIPPRYEFNIVRKDGQKRRVEISSSVIRDSAGEVKTIAQILDITERKQAEEALRQSQEQLLKIFESVTEGITVVDLNGVITEANQRTVEMHGFGSRDELLGKSALELVVPRDRERVANSMRQAIKKGTVRGVEYTLLRADGSKFFGELSTNVLKDASGDVVGHITVARDITERKQAEKVFEALATSSPIGIYIIQDRTFQFVSPRFQELLGYSEEELFAMNPLRFVQPEDREMVREKAIRMLKGGYSSPYEYRYISKDGQTKWVLETVVSIQYRGKRATLGNFLDITERKQAEEELRLRAQMLDGATDSIFVHDLDDNFIYVNEAACRAHGYSREELMRMSIPQVIAPEQLSGLPSIRQEMEEKGKLVFESAHICKDGSIMPVEVHSRIIESGGRKVFLDVIHDITERKRAEEELKLRAQILDSATDSIFVHDGDDNFIYVNEAACRAHGYSREEFMKMKLPQLVAPERARPLALDRQELLEKGHIVTESTHLRKDGSIMPVEVHARTIELSWGKLFLNVVRDITERKRAEAALRESQEFSSNLLENSPDPIFVVNPDTSIKYVNPAFEKLTGFALDEIIGRKAPYPWWPEEQRKEIAASFKDAIVSGGNRDEQVRRRKSGERFWVAINSAPIMHEGKLSYFLVSWLDVTERKRAEEERIELEQKAHLASRLASVGEMASGIAHEINNPMTAVIGFSQLLMEADLPDDVKEDISVIHKEAQRAASVARNLLTFARKHSLAKQLTNVNSIVEGVLKLRAYEQSVSNIRVDTRLAPDLPEVLADYSQMQQVFINIILNAEAAMLETANGGKLTITTQRIDGSIRASFTDSGPGIAKENLNRIFDPFFTTKEVGKGTGLGLSVCHGIIAEHGGRIYARSKVGYGATFVVELPINVNSNDGGEVE